MRGFGIGCALLGLLALAACSFFHDDLPGTSCRTGMDCFKGIETCDPITRTCMPLYDAGPVPDVAPVPDRAPDASEDAAFDASTDAAADAAADGAPDAT